MEDPKGSSASARVAEAPAPASAGASVMENIGRYRWRICGLLFYATTLNYIDRSVFGLLKPRLMCPDSVAGVLAGQADKAIASACINPVTHQAMTGIGLTEVNYGYIVMAFSLAYAGGLLLVGRMIDRLGVKLGFALAVLIWGLAAASHSLASVPSVVAWLSGLAGHFGTAAGAVSGAVIAFAIARLFLGLGESGNFPACIKTVAEWFPQKERAFATGIFNSGANVGALIAPLTVPWIADHLGWRWGFLMTASFCAVWTLLWLRMYGEPHQHPRLSEAELRYIDSGAKPEPPITVPLSKLIPKPQAWAVFFGKLMTDPAWWFYLYWLPGFLNRQYGLPLGRLGWPLVVIYNLSAVGSIYGGWLPGKFIGMGWNVNKARKTAMLFYAIAVLPVVFVGFVHNNLWGVVILIGIAAAAHQAFSANMFTLASDMFPKRAVASVVSLGTIGSAFLFAFFSILIGYVLKWTGGNYAVLFVACGVAYLSALFVIHTLAPKLEPADVD